MINTISIQDEVKDISPEILRYLDWRLHEWANWNLEKDHHGLDYAHENMLHRFRTYGVLPLEKSGLKPLPSNPPAEEMESIVSIMATQNKQSGQYAAALREFYLGPKRGSKREAAKMMGVSEKHFYECLQAACTWLAGWFTGQYAFILKLIEDDSLRKQAATHPILG